MTTQDQVAAFGRRNVRPKVAAEHMKVTEGTLAKWRMRGFGPAYSKLSRSLILYDLDDCDAWIAAHRQQSTSEAA